MSLPIDFVTRTQALLGDEFIRLEEALQADPPVSVRLNRDKCATIPVGGDPVAWCETGFYLPERLSFTFDPLFHAGAYYVQEAASMFLEQAVKAYVFGSVRCLDLCAAPGGKSTHLASLLPKGSLLVSNEVIRSRSQVLAENLAKWGRPDTVVLNNDPEEIGRALPHFFDLVVADVPCSGEGMFRKDRASVGEWSVDNVRLCASRQRRIICDVWDALRPGGLLIYSTCTYNTEENEDNIHYIVDELGAEVLPLQIPMGWQVTGSFHYAYPVYRFFPHKTRGEGFFLAVLRKAEGERKEIRFKSKMKKEQKGKATLSFSGKMGEFLGEKEGFKYVWRDNFLYAYPLSWADLMPFFIEKPLRVLAAGICLGESKGKDFVPSQELALSTALRPNAFPSVDLSWQEAIRFLRKEAVILPADTEKGYVLVRYQKLPLGFLKNLGNRTNNLYPQEWRIRTNHLPEEIRLLS